MAFVVFGGGKGLDLTPARSWTCGRRARQFRELHSVRRRTSNGVSMNMSEPSRGVVITGSTKGIGLALARKFTSLGHRVVICGRNEERLQEALRELEVVKESTDVMRFRGPRTSSHVHFGHLHRLPNKATGTNLVFGIRADVSDADSVAQLAAFATKSLGRIDYWINNAGTNSYIRQSLVDIPPNLLKETVDTNLLGSLLCSREAIRTLESQDPPGGHVFNMEGAGSFGGATAGYAAYGATKRALPQLNDTMIAETRKSSVGCHILSPGMVLTDLLLSESTPEFRRFFNLIAEEPETVAEDLVPRILQVSGTGKKVRFLTIPGALVKIITSALFSRNRFFDNNGDRIEGTTSS